jgi:hypothetical protein
VSFNTRRIVALVVMLLGSTLGGLLASGRVHRLAVGSHRWCSAWRGGGTGIHINLGESKRLTTWAPASPSELENRLRCPRMAPPVLLLLAYNTARTYYAPLFAWPIGLGRYVPQRTSPYRSYAKFGSRLDRGRKGFWRSSWPKEASNVYIKCTSGGNGIDAHVGSGSAFSCTRFLYTWGDRCRRAGELIWKCLERSGEGCGELRRGGLRSPYPESCIAPVLTDQDHPASHPFVGPGLSTYCGAG